jgi:peptidoglycan/LPS O-acetylase OafA/YrhL
MRSSTGEHFIALDHVRALAAFMVVTWHFTHGLDGSPIPLNYVPALFPFSLLDEGQTGVSLFMTLSGYLFAKLLDGKNINYVAFLWNRALRLIPLLLVVFVIFGIEVGVSGRQIFSYVYRIAQGAIFPTLPNGGWSITTEFHYYIILPLFLWMTRKSKLLPLTIIIAAIALRSFLYHKYGEIQSLAYFTIIGRIDQFALGMLIYQFRRRLAQRHRFALVALSAFMMFYWYFDFRGGFYQNPSYPSNSPLWIFLPTIEGMAYAIGIAWYDSSFSPTTTVISGFIGRIGAFSYSIYMFHLFIVFNAATFVNERIMNISNFYVACLWSLVFFILMAPIGYLSFRFIEAPFLKLRIRYISGPHGTVDR